jgi:hypothetical protein
MIDAKQILAPDGFRAHWGDSISDEIYHADRTCIGSSQLRSLIDSPKRFYHEFFKGETQEPTEAMKLGTLIHQAILEGPKFRENYVVAPEFGDQRTKAAKEAKASWFLDVPKDKMVVSKEDFDILMGVTQSILEHPQARDLLKNGKPEIAGYFVDEETGIKQKIKPDFLTFNSLSFVDLKSTKSAEHRLFMNSIFSYRYDIQIQMYREGIKAITGIWPEIISIIAVEKTPPYESAVYFFNDFSLEQAAIDYHNGLRKLKKCIDTGIFPQRQTMIQPVVTPQWFIYSKTEDLNG